MTIFKEVKGEGQDVVVLHGWSCDHRYMRPVVDELARRFRVTNIDLPGAGQSDWQPTIRTIHDFADQLLSDLPDKAVYIGWSFGGLVSMSIGSRYPERMRRFVGITTSPKFVAGKGWSGVPEPGFKAPFAGIQEGGFKAFMKVVFDSEFADFSPKPKAYYDLRDLLEQGANRDLDVLSKGIDICDATDLRKEFKSLQCPIDLIFGEQDEAVPLSGLKKIKQLNPNVNIHIIHGAHHMPFWTHSAEFKKTLHSIL